MAVYVFRYIWHYLLVQGGLIMKLKKRIYLLTPLLVLVCVIAAGVFMKAPAKVEAESYLIEKGTYESTKLIDVIDNENSDKYDEELGAQFDLVEFDTVLFDYNGDEWNQFWSIINQQQDYYFSFKSYGEISKSINEGKYINANFETGVNSGGTPVKQGILDDELVDGMPKFSAISFPYYNETWGKRMGNILFGQQTEFGYTTGNAGIKNGLAIYSDVGVTDGKAEIDAAAGLIRENIFPSKFQFVYDNTNGYYTYNSTVNHAQYNKDTQKVELYADTLGMTNGTKSQISLLEDKLANNNDYVIFDGAEGTWELLSNSDTNCKVKPGTATDYFTPSMRFTSFKEPLNKQMNEQIGQSLKTDNIEYIYVNFVINYNDISNEGSDNTIKFILTETDVELQNGKPVGNNNDGTYTQTSMVYDYFEYSYNYTDKLYEASNGKIKAEVELKIPVEDDDLANLDSIEQIAIVPFNGNKALYDVAQETNLYFYLKDFGIGYNTNGRNNGQTDNNSISSFLPFQKIEDSYEGESAGKKNFESYLDTWSEKIKDSTSKVANRAVVNKYHENGLDAIEANSFGKTAPHFGMSMNIDFIIPDDGVTDFAENIVFEFNGDDDLWVFVDGKLVLDMGGQHHAQNGKIDFSAGKVIYTKAPIDGVTNEYPNGNITFWNGAPDTNDTTLSGKLGNAYFESMGGNLKTYVAYESGLETTKAEDGVTILSDIFTPGKHNVKVFYLERASGVSNCFIRFNLPQIPTADVIVSNEIKVSEDSDVKDITEDLNGDGILDENVSIFNDNGKLSYKYTDIEGNEQITSDGLVTFDYIAEYLVPSEYDIDGTVLPVYTGTYNLYKTDDPTSVYVENLNIEIIKQDDVTKEVDVTSDGNLETKGYTKYVVRFSVPVGYYAKIALPESSIVNYINQESPKYSDVGLSPLYRYDDTDFVVKATYYANVGDVKLVEKEESSKHESEINNVVSGSSIGDYEPTVFLTGDNENEASVLRTDFTNYIAMDLYELEIEKTFLDGKPVPVGQSILYTVECGLHSEGETCDNPLCGNPLYISMLIKDTKDSEGNVITPNPNTITVRDLPKGNYKITEKADWSWRYECYNVEVQRNDAEKYGDGTVISAATSTPAP